MLELIDISKRYGDFSLQSVSFRVEEGDYFMLLGPSGAGKSQILEIIAGIVRPDSGAVLLNGVDITALPPGRRNTGLVFQDLALFPNMSVEANIGYALRRKGVHGSELRQEVERLAVQMQLQHLMARRPKELSGGEQQRVALARTLALKPLLLLVDEPLSSVDVALREELRSLLRAINRGGQTVVHVTHDYDEAISLGNRLAVLHLGAVVQQGAVLEVFRNPASEFIARFGGIRNFFRARLSAPAASGLRSALLDEGPVLSLYSDSQSSEGYVFFPENAVTISVAPLESSQQNTFTARITELYPLRFGYEVVADAGFRVVAHITAESVAKLGLAPGSIISVSFKASALNFIPSA